MDSLDLDTLVDESFSALLLMRRKDRARLSAVRGSSLKAHYRAALPLEVLLFVATAGAACVDAGHYVAESSERAGAVVYEFIHCASTCVDLPAGSARADRTALP